MDKCDFFRYNYKLSILEDVYNVFKNNGVLINYPSPDALDSLGSYIPSPGHTGWDLEGAHKTVWAVGLGIFDPCKKGSLVQALPLLTHYTCLTIFFFGVISSFMYYYQYIFTHAC